MLLSPKELYLYNIMYLALLPFIPTQAYSGHQYTEMSNSRLPRWKK